MGIYATAVIPYDGKLIIFDTPVPEAAPLAENTDRGRIFSIDEILQKRYGEDFHEYITNYIYLKPESVAKKLGVSGPPSMKALHTRFNRVESVIGQKPCAMIVDVIVTSVIEAELPADGNGFLSEGTVVGFANHECGGQAGSKTPETGKDSCPPPDAGSALRTRCRRASVDFRLRYLLDMRKGVGNVIGPIVILYRELDGDVLHSPLLIRATKYLLPVMYEDDYEAGVASKLKSDKAGLCASIRLDSLPGTAEWERDNKKVSLEAEKWGELAKMMTGDFKQSFDIVRRARGITVAELSRRLGISVQYYSKMINGHISTSQLVGICVELNLRIDISFRLLELSGNRLTYKEVDCFYMTMLASPEEFTLERCNDILKSNGYPPFFPRSKNSDDSMG